MTGTASASARSSGSVQVEDGVDESENDDDNDDHTENENNDESERDHDSEHDDVGVPVESTKSQSGLHDSESDGKRSAADTDSAIAIPIANGTDSSTTVVASTNTSASTSSSIENGAAISNGDHEPAQDGEPNDVTTTSAGFHCIESLDESVNLLDYVREHNTTLKFPEKLMLALTYVERECAKSGKAESSTSIAWVLDGKAFVVRNDEKQYSSWLPQFFGQSKFSSFTRKLYRWGFRKINMSPHSSNSSQTNLFFFGNEHFQRDKKDLLSLMKSVTAAKTRCEIAADSSKASWPETNAEGNSSEDRTVNASYNVPVAAPQIPVPLAPAVDQASLIQQAINLAALQSLLNRPQTGLPGQPTTQPPVGAQSQVAMQSQIMQATPPAQQLDYNQMLSFMAFSAAFASAAGAFNQVPSQQQPPVQPHALLQGQAHIPSVASQQTQAVLPTLQHQPQPQLHALLQPQPQGMFHAQPQAIHSIPPQGAFLTQQQQPQATFPMQHPNILPQTQALVQSLFQQHPQLPAHAQRQNQMPIPSAMPASMLQLQPTTQLIPHVSSQPQRPSPSAQPQPSISPPWWLNNYTGPAALPNGIPQPPPMPPWNTGQTTMSDPGLPIVPPAFSEQDRIRGVMDMFLRYGQTAQQQQLQAPQNIPLQNQQLQQQPPSDPQQLPPSNPLQNPSSDQDPSSHDGRQPPPDHSC